MRSGRIGTASDSSAACICARHSPADRLRLLDPACAGARARRVGLLEHPRERRLRVAETRGLQRIVAAERLGIDVDLDRRHADLRHRPEMRRHAAGLAADEADEVGAR